MNYQFLDQAHRLFYEKMIEKTNSHNDCERKALFYLLGLTEETRKNINVLYDFKEHCIDFDGLDQGWQTGTSIRVSRLAFNLFNGFCGEEEEEARDYMPRELFCNELKIYMLQAVAIRFE